LLRKKRNLSDLELARREAVTIAHTGLTLDVATREFTRAFDILGRAAVAEAARFFKARAESTLPVLSVAEAVARFVAAKVGRRHFAALPEGPAVLPGTRFGRAFQVQPVGGLHG
jgi:hypothetical protein